MGVGVATDVRSKVLLSLNNNMPELYFQSEARLVYADTLNINTYIFSIWNFKFRLTLSYPNLTRFLQVTMATKSPNIFLTFSDFKQVFVFVNILTMKTSCK